MAAMIAEDRWWLGGGEYRWSGEGLGGQLGGLLVDDGAELQKQLGERQDRRVGRHA
jgi:hypothetical protein